MAALKLTQHMDAYDRVSPKHYRAELQGKSVFITGGGYGIGKEIAVSFAHGGAGEIILAGRTESSLQAAVADLSKTFPDTHFSYQVVDLENTASITSLFAALTSSPDILVNNAGYLPEPTNFVEADIAEWWRGFTINVLGTIVMTQEYLRHRETHKQGDEAGVVITINTAGAYELRIPNFTAYAASKAGLIRATELMATDVPESTARFITVHPGAVKTAMYDRSRLAMPPTDIRLASDFVAWSATKPAAFLNGRFVWVNWDVDDLLARRDEILDRDLLRSAISGF